ncbi:hypothetical protein [Amycolatopsis sulphurea]|nr:hypothetical protein [Amycolatopsis sulphurea]
MLAQLSVPTTWQAPLLSVPETPALSSPDRRSEAGAWRSVVGSAECGSDACLDLDDPAIGAVRCVKEQRETASRQEGCGGSLHGR